LIFGIGSGAVHQLRLAAADMYPPSRRAEGLGYVLTGSLVGAFGGPLLIRAAEASSPTLGLDPISLSWIFVPGVILPSLFLVLLINPDPKEIAGHLGRYYPGYVSAPFAGARPDGEVNLLTFVRHYPKLTAFVASFAVQGNMNMIMAMTSLALSHHGHPLSAISLSVAIHVVGMFGFSLPLGMLSDRLGRRAILLAGMVLAGGGSILVPMSPSYWIITAGTFLVGLGWSCVNVAAAALIADTTSPPERGRAIGTNDTFSSAAAVVLPLAGGLWIELVGLPFLGVLGAALSYSFPRFQSLSTSRAANLPEAPMTPPPG
ncbi:MAG: MFS transporter, partial [bacterium]